MSIERVTIIDCVVECVTVSAVHERSVDDMAVPLRSLSPNDIETYMRCGENPDRLKKAIADAMDLTEFAYDPLQAATIELVMQTLE